MSKPFNFADEVEALDKSGFSTYYNFLIDTSEIIHKEFIASKLTKKEFAAKLGISVAYLTDIQRCNRATTIQARARILKQLGYSIKFEFIKDLPE